MQNLIVLCQSCVTWIEPHSEMCPECGADVILDQPDPDRELLTELLGKPVIVLGPVSVERRGLPNYGFLIGTTGGLLFLPRLNRRLNGAWEALSSRNMPGWWPFRGDLTSPRFFKWLRRPFVVANDDSPSDSAIDQNTESLADRLLDSPGAFYIDRRMIRAISGRRRTINVDRGSMRSLTLIDETKDGSLRVSLTTHTSQSGWDDTRAAM